MGSSAPVELWADESGDMRAQALWLPDSEEIGRLRH